MAAVALNTFKTVRHLVIEEDVVIYTAPIGVAAITLAGSASKRTNDGRLEFVTISHYRNSPDGDDLFPVSYKAPVFDGDSLVFFENGRLVLEVDDALVVSGSSNGTIELVISILETAKA